MKSILIFLFFSLSLVHAESKEQIPIAEAFKGFSTYQIIKMLGDNYSGLKYVADNKGGECLAALNNLDKLRGGSPVPEKWDKQMGITLTSPKGYEFDYLYDDDTGNFEPIFTAKDSGKITVVNSKGKIVIDGRSCNTKKKPTSIDLLVESIKDSRAYLGSHKNKAVSAKILGKVSEANTKSDVLHSVKGILSKSKPYGKTTEEGHFMLALRAEIQRRALETCQNTKGKKLKPIRDTIQYLNKKRQQGRENGLPLDGLGGIIIR